MSIFDTQFGGAPLINTYQFNQGPGFPDISGYRGLLQGARMPAQAAAGGGARQAAASADDITGLTGQVRSYRSVERALKATRDDLMNKYFSLFENQYAGDWDAFYQEQSGNIRREVLKLQEGDAVMEAELLRMKGDRGRYDKAMDNPKITDNLALISTADGHLAYGRLTGGRGVGWAPAHEVEQVFTGGQALPLIGEASRIGESPMFPSEYDSASFHTDLNAAFDDAVSSTIRSEYSREGPQDISNRFSNIRSESGFTEQNTEAILGVIRSPLQHLSPHGQTAILAQTLSSVGVYLTNPEDPDSAKRGVPEYTVSISRDRAGAPTIIIGQAKDNNGNLIVHDVNDPEGQRKAVESMARRLAAAEAGTRFRFSTRHSETLRFGEKPPATFTGINSLATEGNIPGVPMRQHTTLGYGHRPVMDDIQAWGNRLDNVSLRSKFNAVLYRLYEGNQALLTELRSSDTSVERKREIGALFISQIENSRQFTNYELQEIYAASMNQPSVPSETVWARGLREVTEFTSRGRLTAATTDGQVVIHTGDVRPPEARAAMARGITINVHQDNFENVEHFNNYSNFTHKAEVNIAGFPTQYRATDINPGGIVFVADGFIQSRRPFLTGQGENDYKIYAGREGQAILPEDIARNTQVQGLNRRGQVVYSPRRRFSQITEHDKNNTVQLNSEDFVRRIGSEVEANAVRAAILRAHPELKLSDKVTFIPGVVAVTDPVGVDIAGGDKHSVDNVMGHAQETMNFNRIIATADHMRAISHSTVIDNASIAPDATESPVINPNELSPLEGRSFR